LVARPHADERPAAAQAAAVQGELERALPVAGARVAVRLPPAAGPEHDAAAPPPAARAAAVQGELERALPVAGARVAVRLPPAAVPDHDAAGPVVPFRDHAPEPAARARSVLDVHPHAAPRASR